MGIVSSLLVPPLEILAWADAATPGSAAVDTAASSSTVVDTPMASSAMPSSAMPSSAMPSSAMPSLTTIRPTTTNFDHEEKLAIVNADNCIIVKSSTTEIKIEIDTLDEGTFVWTIRFTIQITPNIVYVFAHSIAESITIQKWQSFLRGEVGALVGNQNDHNGYMLVVDRESRLECSFHTGTNEREDTWTASSIGVPFGMVATPLRVAIREAETRGLPFGDLGH